MRRIFALGCLLAASTSSFAGDDVALLPLGDPARAYILASGNAGEIVDCRDLTAKGPVSFEAMIADLSQVDVVLIGEQHSNLEGHQFEQRVVAALAASGRPVVLGLEFFEVTDDAALKKYVAGEIDTEKMLADTEWYGVSGGNYNFTYYQPAVEAVKVKGFSVHGVNVPRDWVRTVSRNGRDKLTDEQKQYMPDPGATDEKHRHVVNRLMGGFGASMPEAFDGMYRGQITWDSAMAASILRIRNEGSKNGAKPLVAVIVGSAHVGHGLGIPARLRASEPGINIRILSPVSADKPQEEDRVHPGFVPKESATFSRGYGDYVYVLADSLNQKAYPDFGLRMSASGAAPDTKVTVSAVTPGGIAERAGLQKGDRMITIDGVPVTSVAKASYLFASKRWDEIVVMDVARDFGNDKPMQIIDVRIAVVPPTDGEDDALKSAVMPQEVVAFDPTGARAFVDDRKMKPDGVYSRIVTLRHKPVRIDVMNGSVLEQAWKLDDAGRPVLGLLSKAAPDGAVRVELTRDEAGKVTSQRRLGLRGQPIVQ